MATIAQMSKVMTAWDWRSSRARIGFRIISHFHSLRRKQAGLPGCFFSGGGHMTSTDIIDRLIEHKTLGSAPREELAWLASHGTVRRLNAGDVLTAKGATVEGLFVVLSGHVAICVDRGAGRNKVMDWRACDCRRRSRRPRGHGVRRIGRAADAAARSARPRRSGGQQLPD